MTLHIDLPLQHRHRVSDIPTSSARHVVQQDLRARQKTIEPMSLLDRDASPETASHPPILRDVFEGRTFPEAPEAGNEASRIDRV
jgi:hypothetical protein